MRILAGIDLGIEGYNWLLERASAFAALMGGKLDLVYVTSDPARLGALEEMLQRVPVGCRGKAFTVEGSPEDKLIELSRTYDALVVGPREPAGLERYLQGAMSVRVLRRTRCPIYVPRTERLTTKPVRLLVGVDLESDRHDYVLGTSAALAARVGGTLDLVYAIPRSLPAMRRPELQAAAEREWAAQHEPLREQLMAMLEENVPEENRGEARISAGEPEDALIEESAHYHLLVVGNRERRGLSRLLLGGVARHIVRQADSDVLVLPTASLDQAFRDTDTLSDED